MISLHLRILLLFLVPLVSIAQEDWGSDFESWDIEESSLDSGDSSVPNAEKIAGVAFAIIATVLAGFAVRFPRLHFLRPLFLLSSVAFLGFYLGGCPCPIKGFESLVILFNGEHVHWMPLILLGSTLLLSPFLGSVWCGWICHLGGLQEFLFRKNLIKPPIAKVSGIFLWVRRVAGLSFILWICFTVTSFWEPIDPFRASFNLMVTSPVGWTLLILMLLSSLFVYRPFCRTFCPVGLLIGEVNRLPFVAKIRVSEKCVRCKKCSDVCGMGAIDRGYLNHANCIACGMCMDSCRKNAIRLKFQ